MTTSPVVESSSLSWRERCWGGTVLGLAAALMLAPAFGPLERDSFPLSTFRMFAEKRGQPSFHQMLTLDANGQKQRVPPAWLGTSEVLQAKALLDTAARDPKRRQTLCERVAARARREASEPRLVSVALYRVRFDPIAYFSVGPVPLEQKRLHACPVSGAAGEMP